MAKQSNVIVNYTDHLSGKTQQKTITDINPQASNSKLATWGQMTLGLTKDNYGKTTRIDKIDCDNANQRTVNHAQYMIANAWVNVPDDGVINVTTADFQPSGSKTYFNIKFRVSDQLVFPQLTYSTNAATQELKLESEIYNGVDFGGTNSNLWVIKLYVNATTLEPQTVNVKIEMPATASSDVWEKTITFNVTEPELEPEP